MTAKFDGLFTKTTPLTAMDRITAEARLIIDEEARRRSDLTASLKAAGLARDAARPKIEKAVKKKGKA